MTKIKPSPQDNKAFSKDVVEWWIKWVRIHNKKVISEEEAKSELTQLQSFVTDLKSLYDDKEPKK
ncbi:MAG: hypothetical protein CME68_11955 [Halobacteriovoraceae bacterium]|nr:hypothetical protein [Halobacteriovoraceae bacterium]|tara:strand:+ start:81 stop:275 length:195 start_codon:yes stop_codon:yes gene_type:complete